MLMSQIVSKQQDTAHPLEKEKEREGGVGHGQVLTIYYIRVVLHKTCPFVQ